MDGYGLADCAKRLGTVLLGRPDPTVQEMRRVAHEIQTIVGTDPVSHALHSVYEGALAEPVPAWLSDLIDRLPMGPPRSYRPRAKTTKGGKGA